MSSPASVAERERFVDDLLAYMTIAEKAGQLAILPHAPDPLQRRAQRDHAGFFDRLGAGLVGAVGGITSHAQAAALQRVAIEETRLGIPLFFVAEGDKEFGTVMPSPAAAAASWDMDAIEAAEGAVADEAHSRGISWILAPEIRLIADCANPEFAQSTGGDAFLASRIAVARIRGLQHTPGDGETGTLACLGLTEEGHSPAPAGSFSAAPDNLQIALEALHEANIASINIECGNHRLAGSRATTNHPTLEFLRRPGTYAGMLLTDWSMLATQAGQDPLVRGVYDLSPERLVAAIREGQIHESRLDDAVRRVLRAKFDLGLFRTHSRPVPAATPQVFTPRPHAREAALELARRSIILLRNETQILPLGVESREILVVGTAASDRSIALAGRDGKAASLIDGMEQLGIPYKYVPGLALRHEGAPAHRLIEADRMAIGMASEAARRAHTIIVALGHDVVGARHNSLGEAQRQLLSALATVNPRLVLVTLGARPINPAINGEPLPCVLHAGHLGTMSGHAIAEVLAGDFTPSGRLPAPLEARDPARSLPFGYGLGYGRFSYTNFSVEMGADRMLASVDLRNLGDFAGRETVQLYIARADSRRRVGNGLLRDFAQVALKPGERRRVTFEIGAEQLGRTGDDGRLTLEEGIYIIEVGPDRTHLQRAEMALPTAVAHAMRGRYTAQPVGLRQA